MYTFVDEMKGVKAKEFGRLRSTVRVCVLGIESGPYRDWGALI